MLWQKIENSVFWAKVSWAHGNYNWVHGVIEQFPEYKNCSGYK